MEDRVFWGIVKMIVVMVALTFCLAYAMHERKQRFVAECEAGGGVYIPGRGLVCIPKEKFR
jgi:hypothetical protein